MLNHHYYNRTHNIHENENTQRIITAHGAKYQQWYIIITYVFITKSEQYLPRLASDEKNKMMFNYKQTGVYKDLCEFNKNFTFNDLK